MKRKILAAVFAVLLAVAVVPGAAWADTLEENPKEIPNIYSEEYKEAEAKKIHSGFGITVDKYAKQEEYENTVKNTDSEKGYNDAYLQGTKDTNSKLKDAKAKLEDIEVETERKIDESLRTYRAFMFVFVCVVIAAGLIIVSDASKPEKVKERIEQLEKERVAMLAEMEAQKSEQLKRVQDEEKRSRERIMRERESLVEEKAAIKDQTIKEMKALDEKRISLKEEKELQLKQLAVAESNATYRIRREKETLAAQKEETQKVKNSLKMMIKETKQGHPELARQIADVQYYMDTRACEHLLGKKRPAVRAADEVKTIAAEKRQLLQENKQLHYQIDFYEKMFPWLEEFKELPTEEAISYATGAYGAEYDAVRKWLSPEEYEKLDNSDKFQLALDRWKDRSKSDWDVGIEYERYIGYRLECDGYKVSYAGAMLGLKDMGRDLLATKNEKTLVIQCKRWAKEKTIHEKHIFQLYGSVAVLAIENPDKQYKGVFITTASLSDTARMCAEYCGISVVELCPMEEYPLIKCNASKTGEKIYHLPFDQQYDKVVISKNKQSCYVWTTKEAEEKGFRRAYRWHPEKS